MNKVTTRKDKLTKLLDEVELIPPDLKRCQTVLRSYHPFAFGATPPERCEAKPVWIATEIRVAADGQRGSMSLCDSCMKKFLEKMGNSYATLVRIDIPAPRKKRGKDRG